MPFLAQHGSSGMLRLVDGVLRGFQPRQLTAPLEPRAVARGENHRIGCVALTIDQNAVLNRQAGITGEIIIGLDADADDNQIDRQDRPIRQFGRGDMAIDAGQTSSIGPGRRKRSIYSGSNSGI